MKWGKVMRKTDLVRFKRIFVEQRSQMLMNVTVIDENLMVRPEDKDEVDQANADIEQNMRMVLKNRETFTLKKINEAIKRIEEGSYGLCESCDEAIELRRLQARPTTTLCIACKEEEEKISASVVLGHRFQFVH
jgi:DnaK suppressor protein